MTNGQEEWEEKVGIGRRKGMIKLVGRKHYRITRSSFLSISSSMADLGKESERMPIVRKYLKNRQTTATLGD